MFKNSLLVILLLCFYVDGFSQEITIGIKGGVNYYSNRDIQGYGSGYTNDVFPADNVMGNQFGGYLEVNFGGFLIRPELMFTSLENSYNFPTKPAKWTSSRMDIPIMFGYHVLGPLKIVMGPVISSVTDFYMEGLDDHSNPVMYDKSSMNFQVGIILEYMRFGIDLRYEHGLKKVPFQGDENRVDFTHGYQGYGINLANLNEFNSGQIILSVQIGILRFNPGERKRSSSSDWRNHKRL